MKTDYQKAKEASELQKGKEVSFQIDDVKLFRKYLNDFKKNTTKEFSTKSDNNEVRIIRIK